MPAKTQDKVDAVANLNGLVLSGRVVGRRRKVIKTQGKDDRYLITISVVTERSTFRVDRWSDTALPTDVPTVGSDVSLQVGVRAFMAGGRADYRLTTGDDDGAENF